MKRIPLTTRWGTTRAHALVDDQDYEALRFYEWRLQSDGYAGKSLRTKTGCGRKRLLMHRLINNTPEGMLTDHINRNRLDNRRSNLRTCTVSQNGMNRTMKRNSKTGFKGVTRRTNGRFVTSIGRNGKSYYVGTYRTAREAAKAYKDAAQMFHGRFVSA